MAGFQFLSASVCVMALLRNVTTGEEITLEPEKPFILGRGGKFKINNRFVSKQQGLKQFLSCLGALFMQTSLTRALSYSQDHLA